MSSAMAHDGPAVNRMTAVLLPFIAAFFLQEVYRVSGAVVAPHLVAEFALDARDIGLLTSIYFFTFAAMQLPAGLLLDRFGPRRVLAALLCVGILGALVFAAAPGFAALSLGRALLGLAGSSCLMASFTAAALWFARERLVLVNGAILGLGSLGGLVATVPAEWLLRVFDWRWLWVGLAGLTALAIIALLRLAPERAAAKAGASGWSGYAAVFRMPLFWRIAPATMLTQGSWLAYQGLWAGAWLADVAGLERSNVAAHLLLMVSAAVPGYLVFGIAAERLQRLGLHPRVIFIGGQAAFLAVQAAILLLPSAATWVTWTAFGILGTAGGLGFSILTQAVSPQLAGRANSALNLMLFAGAFALQFGIGAMIGLWPRDPSGAYPVAAHWWTCAAQLALQGLALGWFFLAPRVAGGRGSGP
jgi:predicted MFS family arabinose efflux permease